jgi:hypothetical protein
MFPRNPRLRFEAPKPQGPETPFRVHANWCVHDMDITPGVYSDAAGIIEPRTANRALRCDVAIRISRAAAFCDPG